MESKKIIFLASLLGILLLIILSQSISKIQEAQIKSIHVSEEKATIITEENQTLILFETNTLDLKNGDFIEFEGSKDLYRGKEQIIIDKIWKIK